MAPTDTRAIEDKRRYIAYKRASCIKKPRHTPDSRREATRRERLRVKHLAVAYKNLHQAIPFDKGTKVTYLVILKGAIAYIKALEIMLGIRQEGRWQDSRYTNNKLSQERSVITVGSEQSEELSSIKVKPEPMDRAN